MNNGRLLDEYSNTLKELIYAKKMIREFVNMAKYIDKEVTQGLVSEQFIEMAENFIKGVEEKYKEYNFQ